MKKLKLDVCDDDEMRSMHKRSFHVWCLNSSPINKEFPVILSIVIGNKAPVNWRHCGFHPEKHIGRQCLVIQDVVKIPAQANREYIGLDLIPY
jgi:hypothetical protein